MAPPLDILIIPKSDAFCTRMLKKILINLADLNNSGSDKMHKIIIRKMYASTICSYGYMSAKYALKFNHPSFYLTLLNRRARQRSRKLHPSQGFHPCTGKKVLSSISLNRIYGSLVNPKEQETHKQ